MWRRVLFPLPEGPMMASISPSSTSRSTPFRAEKATSPMR